VAGPAPLPCRARSSASTVGRQPDQQSARVDPRPQRADLADHVAVQLCLGRAVDPDLERAAADPLDPGVDAPSAPWATAIVPLLGLERRGSRLYLPGATATIEGADELLAELEATGFTPLKVADAGLARALEQEGRLVRLGGEAVSAAAYERARELLVEDCAAHGEITLARFRDLIGTGRRPAQLLLERFDADGVTRRIGDRRVLRRAAR